MSNDEPVLPSGVDLLPSASVPQALPDIPGGQPNLLHKSMLGVALRIEVPMWQNSDPQPGRPEVLTVFWNGGNEVEKTWTAPIPATDLFVEFSPSYLNHGQFEITYSVMTHNGQTEGSQPMALTIDEVPPVLGANRGVLSFPDVTGDLVTEKFLQDHNDRLRALVPDYDAPMAGDIVRYYWGDDPVNSDKAGELTLSKDAVVQPVFIEFSGDLIRERGDGLRYAYYEIEDRAGNLSNISVVKGLMVEVQPLPRTLPWPEVPQAAGSGERVTLALEELDHSLQVKLPESADIRPGEAFSLQWGAPGLFRGLKLKGQPDVRSFTVPAPNVVAMSGKTLDVYYEIEAAPVPHKSAVLQLTVSPLPVVRLPIPTFAGLTGGSFDVDAQSRDPDIALDAWKLISTDQCITIEVVGAGGKRYSAYTQHTLTREEVTDGIGKKGDLVVPLTFMRTLPRGQQFYVEVTVSFDAGNTWPQEPNFQRLGLLLK